jgi:hypothetical protein
MNPTMGNPTLQQKCLQAVHVMITLPANDLDNVEVFTSKRSLFELTHDSKYIILQHEEQINFTLMEHEYILHKDDHLFELQS